ncbi:nitrate- and nitrite sensing domain-containing protein [Streptomyces sp. TRM70350]|uniref:sensor histidine kinase n=1 Tax=Streptomyces sp. TRM70350 TaxID=2856165 RepID=UPI001C490A0C|nr:nitrate- and nitrite sensing domain-containing protein [Streptomyces sp. TRM70350]MBV7697955.1 nitrate- and nitrite sensing domain-containing protein [Streptomyces sp. TRM70350]
MQGRFKRDGSASAEPEPHGGTDRGSSPQHAQGPGPAASGDGGQRSGRPGASTASGRPGASASPGSSTPASTVKSPQGATGPGPRIALRNWRISTRLVALLTLPVVAATSLGALRISQSMDDIEQLDNMKLLTDMTKQATELAAALQEERDQSAGPLAHGSTASAITVKGFQDKTDRALENFLNASEEVDSASKDGNLQGVRDSVVGLARDLNGLNEIRSNAYEAEGNSTQTVEAYHRLIDHLLDLSQDMAEATSNPDMIQRTRALSAFSSAKEYASVQRAVLAAALPANNKTFGDLSENDRLYAQSALESQVSELRSFSSIYGDGAEELLKPIDQNNATIEATDKYASRALSRENGLQALEKRSYRDWLDDSSTKIQQMKNIERTLLEDMEQKARELRSASEREAIISGALVLLVLGVSLVGAFVVARSMIRSLRRLEDTATKVAQERLPELVKQLSESDPQDVDTSVESVGVHSRDEIGRVAAAFDDVHREAVRLAAEQALLRGNVNAMFTNLSRRSQGLIQRQLSLISELESREADPDQLASLFKLDHLATRMRRNGENLLVLAGEEPGRRWTRPVPLVDVLRAAASEVEQYERIELASVPTTQVAGRVVNDLVHLLAELLENATSFSSPQTKVKVTGHALPDGRVLIEIHDTGIGLSPEDLAQINERLASPPTVDVSVSRRMGLFVVGRLSQRHGIRIQLRPSDSGGTTALVMLPVDVAQGDKKPQGKPGQGGPGGGPAAAQAAAGAAAARRGNDSSLGAGAAGGGALGAGAAGGGRLGAGQGPRAALPGRDSGGAPGAPGGARGPQTPPAPQQGRPTGVGNAQTPVPPQGQDARGPVPPQRGGADAGGGRGRRGRQPQLPPRGGARAELPGGNEPQQRPSWSDENAQPPVPRAALDTPRGHDEQRDPSQTAPMPRIDDRQGPGSTAEFPAVPRVDDRQAPGTPDEFPHPGANGPQNNGQFVRSDVFGGPTGPGNPNSASDPGQSAVPRSYDNGSTGQYPAPQRQDNGATGQYPAPQGYDHGSTGQFPAPSGYDNGATGQYSGCDGSSTGQHTLPGGHRNPSGTGQFERPQGDFGGQRPPGPQRPQQRPGRPEPEALPPASGPGDGRTPLYDTLETNWFRGQAGQQGQPGQPPQPGRAQRPQGGSAPAPQQPQGPSAPQAPQRPAAPAWRSSPNDDLVRQAERVRQPAAGGVTTSGLPRRVPRANLVPGTAQQQPHQSGPQVSRAPQDVRGRLTNLRRGIAQGRQAGSGQTGSFPSPTHQQER